MAFLPYLFFNGDCADAFARYQEIFGGELEVMRLRDAPGVDTTGPEADLVIHAALTFDDHLLMASDDTEGGFEKVSGMRVSYSATDEADAKRVFDALAEGGTTDQALQATFFSPAFGMCTDRFGIPWMVSAEPAEGDSPG